VPGSNSLRRPSCFDKNSSSILEYPVTLPPGRLRRATSPSWTGSPAELKTIGIVLVKARAARAPTALPGAAITSTRRPIRSAANSGIRSRSFWPQRNSIARFRPSTKPISLNPLRKAAIVSAPAAGVPARRTPTTGVFDACPRATTGHATAALASPVVNWRRLISHPGLKTGRLVL
jgi:hypothetical protein